MAQLSESDQEALQTALDEELSALDEDDRALIPDDMTLPQKLVLARRLTRRLGKSGQAESDESEGEESKTAAERLIERGREVAEERAKQHEGGAYPDAWKQG